MNHFWMMLLLAAIVLLSGGCSKEIPVALNLDPPEAIEECDASGDEKLPRMQPFPVEAQLSAIDVNAAWSRHEIEVRGVDRRNSARRRICHSFVTQITNPPAKATKKPPMRKTRSSQQTIG